MAKEWFYVRDGAQAGPVAEDEVLHLIRNGDITGDTLVWADGMKDWDPARLHFETRRRFAVPGVPRQGEAPAQPTSQEPRSARRAKGGLYSGAPARGFLDATGTCLHRYFGFSGRASRSEYWYFVLFGFLLGLLASILDLTFFGPDEDFTPIASLTGLLLFFPSLAAAFRRLHDTGRSGAWALLIYVAPVIFGLLAAFFVIAFGGQGMSLILGVFGIVWIGLGLMVLVFLCLRGDPGRNAYG